MLGRPTDQYSRTNCVPQVSPETSKAPTAKAGAHKIVQIQVRLLAALALERDQY